MNAAGGADRDRPADSASSSGPPGPPDPEEAARTLTEHARRVAEEAVAKYGRLTAENLPRILEDRRIVRYPVRLSFGAEKLQPGEFAWAEPLAQDPRAGFVLHVHPAFEGRPDLYPLLAAYHLVTVNYGDVATSTEAEVFGATLAGMDRDAYYALLEAAADSLPAQRGEPAP